MISIYGPTRDFISEKTSNTSKFIAPSLQIVHDL
jgi:hypothetical protein